ncbi:hypothetical protein F4695_002205 [Rhizobium soli]|jgi:hypothetical protein|uniref:Uncharacterized protein n=1 Tax=Rhizobium soli TaxID=424798 RepID=A0A7X0JLI9_9HYPH|nr:MULTISPECIES: hypothetical protein [Rhizobium]MBB6508856.1 hypothetical protein [Rhizobium soli]
MQPIQHHTRAFPHRAPGVVSRWQWVAYAGLVTAAFVFIGAVTLGILA